jgi:hypothetical protein
MMTCKQYIFYITSGQAEESGTLDRFWAAQHRLICHRCRSYTRNDQQLSVLLKDYRESILDPNKSVKH